MEITNTSTGSVVLSGWEVSYLSGGKEKVMIVFPDGFAIGAGEYGVVSNYDLDESRLSDEPMLITSSISLPNSKLLISLIDNNGNLIDQVDDGVGAPFAGSKSPWASMERIDLGSSGSDSDNWRTADKSVGFDDGEEIFGSPGYFEETEESEDSDIESDNDVGAQRAVPNGSGQIIPNVYISEILPNPEGKDDGEWIEIVNDEDFEVNVSNWIIKRSGDEYFFGDFSLGPKSIAVFMKSETEISLKNSGDEIKIFSGSILIDSLSYPTAYDEVSFGRKPGEKSSFASYCVPTKGEINKVKKLYPRIFTESGKKRAEGKTTVNFKAISDHGSLNSATCVWNFDDGFESYKCNPPSHTFGESKVFAVTLSVETVCGTFEEATQYVEVFEKYEEEQQVEAATAKSQPAPKAQTVEDTISCTPTTSTGILITQIFPSPSTGEEWIEIENKTDEVFNLCGWILDDVQKGGSKPWTIEEISIPPKEKIKIMQSQSRISLNNGGDEVWLISPTGYKTGFEYPKIKSDETFGFTQPILAHSASITPGGYWEKKDGLDGAEENTNKIGAHGGNYVGAVPLQNQNDVPLPLDDLNIVDGDEVIIDSDSSSSAILEVSVIVLGVISSVGLFALKILKG